MASALRLARAWLVVGALIVLSACQTPLPPWDPAASGADASTPSDAALEPHLRFDPAALPDAVARVTRIEVDVGRALASPRVVLVEGALTATQLRELARPSISRALAARVQPSIIWTSSETELIVAPLAPLPAGALFTVGVSDPPLALSFTVAADDGLPLLARIWPDPVQSAAAGAAVWCARDPIEVADASVTLLPAETEGRLGRGTGTAIAATSCVSWFPLNAAGTPPAAGGAAKPAMTPPAVPLADGSIALLEPALLWPGAPSEPMAPVSCAPTEVRFGPACATVGDDRIVIRPPAPPVLWTIEADARTTVRQSRDERLFVVRPLPSDSRFRFAALDEGGRTIENEIRVQPAPLRDHVVINEVMANPAGVERAQEWIELFNDGLAPVSMSGYALETGGGTVLLPAEVLAPGAFALIVTDAFQNDDGVDPVAPPDTLLLRVPALGRDGLSNEGERLLLRDAASAVISTFPPMKAKSGVSAARVAPDALDDDPGAFVPSPNGSATPGAPNVQP